MLHEKKENPLHGGEGIADEQGLLPDIINQRLPAWKREQRDVFVKIMDGLFHLRGLKMKDISNHFPCNLDEVLSPLIRLALSRK